jgi:DNA-binding MarR family transcriptional regulator
MSKQNLTHRVGAGVRALQRSTDAFDEAVARLFDLNRTDMRCLDLILSDGPLSAGRVASGAGLSPAAVTTVLDRLERGGWVVRERDPTNRRRVLVSGTKEARRREAEIFGPVARAGTQMMSRYTVAQLEAVLDFVEAARRLQEAQTARLLGRMRGSPGSHARA